MAFLKLFVSQKLFYLFSKHLDTMLNATDCGTGRTDLCTKLASKSMETMVEVMEVKDHPLEVLEENGHKINAFSDSSPMLLP